MLSPHDFGEDLIWRLNWQNSVTFGAYDMKIEIHSDKRPLRIKREI